MPYKRFVSVTKIMPISHFKKVAIISRDSVAELMFARLCLLLIVQSRPEPVPAPELQSVSVAM